MRAASFNRYDMDILYKSKNAVVVYKEYGIPAQPDPTGDKDAMTLASNELSLLGESPELFLVHRLDRVVGGLMAFARNKKTAAELSKLVSRDGVGKEYLAVIDGYIDGGKLRDYLYKDAHIGKSFVVSSPRVGVKSAELDFSPLATAKTERGIKSLIKVKLKTGRFHQIRAQFSSRKVPLTGDAKYGSKDNKSRFPALFAYRLSFELFGEKIDVAKLPDTDAYPWCLFEKSVYGDCLK